MYYLSTIYVRTLDGEPEEMLWITYKLASNEYISTELIYGRSTYCNFGYVFTYH